MECNAANALIPGYVDGELSEAQAKPLRQHLLDCAACRAVTQDVKGLRGWFVAPGAVTVPPGFAERVARRAFAGDRGQQWGGRERDDAGVSFAAEPRLVSFVMGLTALAAGLLLAISIYIGTMQRPQTDDLMADDLSPQAVVERLDELNRAEATATPADTDARPEEQR
jgi:anti-sigma factor RsiW